MKTIIDPIRKMLAMGPRTKIDKRRELTAAWRWYEPRPVTWDGPGPRPASSYRAARRNAHRPHMASIRARDARRAARRAEQALQVKGGAR